MPTTRNYRRLILQTLAGIFVVMIAIAAIVIAVDPYHQYRAAYHYLGDARLESAGIARHHDYDAFIIGSSMCVNHDVAQVDSLWGWNARNFAILGCTADDYAVMLPFIIGRGKAHNVIMGLDIFSFDQHSQINEYLYDDNLLNDYQYLWNRTVLGNVRRFLTHRVDNQDQIEQLTVTPSRMFFIQSLKDLEKKEQLQI